MISISTNTGRVIYTQNKKSKYTISTAGLFFSLLGALLVSSAIAPFYGFLAFTLGTLCWLHFGFSTGNKEFILLEFVYLSTNILGMVMYYE